MSKNFPLTLPDMFSRQFLARYPSVLTEYNSFKIKNLVSNAAAGECSMDFVIRHILRSEKLTPAQIQNSQKAESVLNQTPLLASALFWSQYKIIYNFDQTLADELSKTPQDSKIPVSFFKTLPFPCPFVQCKIGNYDGFFAFVAEYEESHLSGLSIVFINNRGAVMPYLLEFRSEIESVLSLVQNLENTISQIADSKASKPLLDNSDVKKALLADVNAAVSILLYLCSKDADVKIDAERRAKYKKRSHPPKTAKEYPVGVRIASGLQRIRSETTKRNDSSLSTDTSGRRSPIPHVRSAHWHSFWIGPRDSNERKLTVKWIPPTLVNCKTADDSATTIIPVKTNNQAKKEQ